mmetsp:Transcript_2017/g.6127  ORF Transcript_2017/g.6127 Transcript_2017/m.6127 type:complete len:501 (+) Transcript_2017:3945-5447(+)
MRVSRALLLFLEPWRVLSPPLKLGESVAEEKCCNVLTRRVVDEGHVMATGSFEELSLSAQHTLAGPQQVLHEASGLSHVLFICRRDFDIRQLVLDRLWGDLLEGGDGGRDGPQVLELDLLSIAKVTEEDEERVGFACLHLRTVPLVVCRELRHAGLADLGTKIRLAAVKLGVGKAIGQELDLLVNSSSMHVETDGAQHLDHSHHAHLLRRMLHHLCRCLCGTCSLQLGVVPLPCSQPSLLSAQLCLLHLVSEISACRPCKALLQQKRRKVALVQVDLADHCADLVLRKDLDLDVMLQAPLLGKLKRFLTVRFSLISFLSPCGWALDASKRKRDDAALLRDVHLDSSSVDNVLDSSLESSSSLKESKHLLRLSKRCLSGNVVHMAGSRRLVGVNAFLVSSSSGFRLDQIVVVQRTVLVILPMLHNRGQPVCHEGNGYVVVPFQHGGEDPFSLCSGVGELSDVVDADSHLPPNKPRAKKLPGLEGPGLVLLVSSSYLRRADA